MAIFKRGKHWNFDFQFRGKRYQGSTYQTNKEKAAQWLRKYRANLADGLVGIAAPRAIPLLSDFLDGPFTEHLKQNHKEKPQTLYHYTRRILYLKRYAPFTTLRLDQVNELAIQGYKEFRLKSRPKHFAGATKKETSLAAPNMRVERVPADAILASGIAIATINAELRVLRMALLFAQKCGLIRYGGVSTLPGERSRMFVLSGELEREYLAAAEYPLRQVAVLMLDLGLRPEEAVSLRKPDVSDSGVTIRAGKTANAHRSLPQTERTLQVFKLLFALFPDSEWVFPGRKKGTHLTRSRVTACHVALHKEHPEWPDFVLYAARHTFGTRLAECGRSVFEICALMGHSSVKVSEKYVHLGSDHLTVAMRQLELYGKGLRGESDEVPVKVPTGREGVR